MTIKDKSTILEPIDYYYDTHLTQEDLMGESSTQYDVVHYLVAVIRWHRRHTEWFATGNLNLYHTHNSIEYPTTPDLVVFRPGVVPLALQEPGIKSWRIAPPQQMSPSVVMEVASESTWGNDVEDDEKPTKYGIIGVSEYYAYDPNTPRVWTNTTLRLRGWRYVNGESQERVLDEQGRLWSDELDSWLVPDGKYLRLYDSQMQLRLTEGEAERRDKLIEREAKIAERKAKFAAEKREKIEREAKLAEREAKERVQAELELLRENLRKNGLDPDKFLN